MDVVGHNRQAWNKQAKSGCKWSVPVSREETAAARQGDWQIVLTPHKAVPREWFGQLEGATLLCLASGGGQQAPILAAAGARVTSFDNSPEQLAADRLVADRDGLSLDTVQGDMADLSAFPDRHFDLIFHPVSNVFAQDIAPVWRECFRVLKPGGRLMSGFMNPVIYLFDFDESKRRGKLLVEYALPFLDLTSLPREKREKLIQDGEPLEFGHTLEQQIGGQIAAGFQIHGFYEDRWDDEATPLNRYCSTSIATLAVKPG